MWYQLASVGCAVQLLLPLACAELANTVNENAGQFVGGMVAMEDHLRNPDIHYHQVEGSMFRRCRDGTRDPNRATLVTLLAMIIESVAWLTRW